MKQLLKGASELFTRGQKTKDKAEGQAKKVELFQKIDRLQMELEWIKRISATAGPMSCANWSITTSQNSASRASVCCWDYTPRSTLYYKPVRVRESTLRIMACINALYLDDPCSGSRRIVDYLAREGIPISRDRMRNIMHLMGFRAIYQRSRFTLPENPAERFPYLADLKQV